MTDEDLAALKSRAADHRRKDAQAVEFAADLGPEIAAVVRAGAEMTGALLTDIETLLLVVDDQRRLLLSFIGSVTLADHLGDVGNDISEVLNRIGGIDIEWDELHDLDAALGKMRPHAVRHASWRRRRGVRVTLAAKPTKPDAWDVCFCDHYRGEHTGLDGRCECIIIYAGCESDCVCRKFRFKRHRRNA